MNERTCRSCGCTDERACVRFNGYVPVSCWWWEADLCCACAPGAASDWIHPLERWPMIFGGVLVEPGTGVVRVRRPGAQPATLAPADARWLAEHPCAAGVRHALEEAALEAERQARVLVELMEAKA